MYIDSLRISNASILSLVIMPYISSSIFPFLSIGNREIKDINRWLTLLICLFQSPVYLIGLTYQFLPFSICLKAYIFF